MAEQIPVTPRLLTWARERAGLSSDEAVEKFRNFAEWEAGRSFPTYPQLEAISEALKVPVAVPDLRQAVETKGHGLYQAARNRAGSGVASSFKQEQGVIEVVDGTIQDHSAEVAHVVLRTSREVAEEVHRLPAQAPPHSLGLRQSAGRLIRED